MNSYISHRNPRNSRPNGYVTGPSETSQPTGYVTRAPTHNDAGSYIDADAQLTAGLLLARGR